jgi:ABC-type nitrate/sulfonate/bicarbonate transport system substrate-binding protein
MQTNYLCSKYLGIPIVLAILFLAVLWGCSNKSEPNVVQPLTKVTIGIQVSPAMTLMMVAKDKGFFSKEGLDVELKQFTAGKFALQAFLSHSIDFAVSGEVPVGLASLQGNQLRVVTQVVASTTNEVRVVALKDGNLTNPQDYFKTKKRKIATSIGGGPEFYTYNFLKKNQVDENQVEIVSQNPADMPAALETGSVDAISIFDPFAFIAEKVLGDKAITFADPTLYSELYVLCASPEEIKNQPQIVGDVVKALAEASDFIQANPVESKAIMQRYTKLDQDVIDGIWNNYVFEPALGQNLLDDLNAEAVWAKDTGKITPDTKIPDYRQIIDDSILKEVRPDAVKL